MLVEKTEDGGFPGGVVKRIPVIEVVVGPLSETVGLGP